MLCVAWSDQPFGVFSVGVRFLRRRCSVTRFIWIDQVVVCFGLVSATPKYDGGTDTDLNSNSAIDED